MDKATIFLRMSLGLQWKNEPISGKDPFAVEVVKYALDKFNDKMLELYNCRYH